MGAQKCGVFDPGRTIVGIIGPNGSGKTSFLKLLMGLLRPESGVIHFFGKDLASLSPASIARQMAFVPQETSQVFSLHPG